MKKYNQQLTKNTATNVKHVPKLQVNNCNKTKTSTLHNKIDIKGNRTNSAPIARSTHLIENNSVSTHRNTHPIEKNVPTHRNTQSIENINAKKPLTISSNRGLTSGVAKLLNNKKKTNDQRATSSANNFNKPGQIASNSKSNAIMENRMPKNTSTSNISVCERLYKPEMRQNTYTMDIMKLQRDPAYLKKVINQTGLIINNHHAVFNNNNKPEKKEYRRSISAVHFKRVSKSELGNCIHKCSSIGDKLNNIDINQVNEDEVVNDDKVVSAILSENTNFNTPQEELQAQLKAWLQNRGKSLESYRHLQCLGIHHLPYNLKFDPKPYKDENKESDSDQDCYTENMNGETDTKNNMWRRVSIVSDSVDLSGTQNTSATCSDGIYTDELVIGALSDLTELLKEGFEWMQCARWLRAIRERFPSARSCAAYWECRANLEAHRGDLLASVKCWEEAIVQGTQHSVAEANLDQLLSMFMQLQNSPNGGKSRQVDPKLVEVKNVFKSTIIRLAVQKAKLRSLTQQLQERPSSTASPVRNSVPVSGLSNPSISGVCTPLQLCTLFVPTNTCNAL